MTTATVTPTKTSTLRDWVHTTRLRMRLTNLERDIIGADQDIACIEQQNDARRDEARELRAELRRLGAL